LLCLLGKDDDIGLIEAEWRFLWTYRM
jgi:hypothetical protein